MSARWSMMAAAAVLASLVTGCVGPGGAACTVFEAQWNQPDLYAKMPDEPFGPGWTLDKTIAPSLEFRHEQYDEAWGPGEYGVVRAAWSVDEGEFDLTASHDVTGSFDDPVPDARVRELFVAFASNVTEADQATIDAWADDFLASKATPNLGPAQKHTVVVEGPYRLTELFGEVSAEYSPTGMGSDEIRFAAWTYELGAPFKVARRDVDRGVQVVAVDGAGETTVSLAVASGERTDALATAEVFFAKNGLGDVPAPASKFKPVGTC